MIYGIVPVGGKGTRLSLPFPKEFLPLKGKNYYYPVCQYTVDNLIEANCEKLYFVHGKEYKEEILNYFNSPNFFHIKNIGDRQSETFCHFRENIQTNVDDIYLYGLPDTWYENNPFVQMRQIAGLVCGMFDVADEAVVDRLDPNRKFVKKKKEADLSSTCWGVLKFDFESLTKLVKEISTNSSIEVAEALNYQQFSLVNGGKYFDLGTWTSINQYWSSSSI